MEKPLGLYQQGIDMSTSVLWKVLRGEGLGGLEGGHT